jgi:hypothetical protein
MHHVIRAALLSVLIAAPIGAMAQDAAPASTPATAAAPAPVVKVGRLLSTSDGRRLGRIDQVDKGADGAPVTVQLFSQNGILYVPVSTISAGSGTSLVTSKSYAEVTKRK